MLVSRDPYCRDELHKESVKGQCSWCGQANRYGKVWKYRLESDGFRGRVTLIDGQFCRKACLDSYHS